MDMSAAALPPIQPAILPAHRAHSRFAEYQAHRSAMSCLLVAALSFDAWLRQAEESESPKDCVFQVKWRDIPESEKPDGALADGWYKHKFAPGPRIVARCGPFASQAEAHAA